MRPNGATCVLASVLGTLWFACVQADDTRSYLVQEPRILAVLADPAEAAPGESVHFQALWVDEMGPVEDARVRWALCSTPRALTENTSVAQVCAESDEQPLSERSLLLDTAIPRDACARFGSETSLGQRPTDPDHSGGYYQPLRLTADGLRPTIIRQRILCPLANAPIDVARRFNERYVPNSAPTLAALSLFADGEQVAAEALPASTAVALRLELADAARESYPLYDSRSGALSTRPEVLRAQWFSTRGELAHDDSEIPALSAENVLTTPEPGSQLWLWIVVRDDRGGVSVHSAQLRIVEAREQKPNELTGR
jgi:hypothetical protein